VKSLEALNTVLLLSIAGLLAYGLFREPGPVLVRAPLAVRSQAQQTPLEYAIDSIPDLEWDTKAKELGAAGWDIITCRRASDSDNKFSYECIMKRPKLE